MPTPDRIQTSRGTRQGGQTMTTLSASITNAGSCHRTMPRAPRLYGQLVSR